MKLNFTTRRFDSIFLEDSRNGLTKPKRIRGAGVKFINMGELFAHNRIFDIATDRVPVTDKERENALLEISDLIFARQSLVLEGVGKCSVIMDITEDTTFDSHLIRVRLNQEIANPIFYYYYFMSPQGKWHVQSIASQVAAAGIKGSDLRSMEVPFPPLPTQRKIAAILSALDDKIENNRKTAEKLEEIAAAVFRRWFVEFEFPDAQGKPYKSSGGKMVESELGLIPEGWEEKKLCDICSQIKPGTNYQPKRVENGIPFLNVRNINSGQIDLNDIKYITEDEYNRVHKTWAPEEGDLLISRIGTLGLVAVIRKKDLPLAVHYNFINIKAKEFSYRVMYFLLKSEDFSTKYHAVKKQSVQEYVTIEDVENIKLALPWNKEFCRNAESFFGEIYSLIEKKPKIASASWTLAR